MLSLCLPVLRTKKEYIVEPLTTGFFSGALDPKKLQNALNQKGMQGWKFVKSIHETKKILGIFSREAHFVIYERELPMHPPQ
jgi:hypothetical protein